MKQQFTVESILSLIRQDVFQNYFRELDEDPTEEQLAAMDVFEDSDVEITDVVRIFRELRNDDLLPVGYSLQITITDEDSRYESMNSRYVLFFRDTPIFAIPFGQVVGARGGQYVGLQPSGLTKILEAILNHLNDREGKLSETISDIAINAGCMITEGLIDVSDSREMVSQFPAWAKEFEENFDPHKQDYLDAVDEFAQKKLREAYGVTVEA